MKKKLTLHLLTQQEIKVEEDIFIAVLHFIATVAYVCCDYWYTINTKQCMFETLRDMLYIQIKVIKTVVVRK